LQSLLILAYYLFILIGAALSVFFFALFIRSKLIIQVVTAAMWLLPIVYEAWVLETCTGECNIRVDLFLLFPLEILLLPALTFYAWKCYRKSVQKSPCF
ncbi:MAG: hypothetical protein LC540_20345, partial [Candidatus Thiodiazotropha sp.]|nr:hypothetical protein [Candidatus Thiodiazotropha sp.]